MSNETTLKEKEGKWLLKNIEDSFKHAVVRRLPKWIETYHLTWLTVLWSVLMVGTFALGAADSTYLWFVPAIVVLQYITDLLDGSLGRYRDTGLVKWGYYMDHFLDYVFMVSIAAGYGILIGFDVWIFALIAVLAGFMVSSFLFVGAHGEFRISMFGIGPTEGRLLYCVVHLIGIYLGVVVIKDALPYIVLVGGVVLVINMLSMQKKLWNVDMNSKSEI